MVVSIDKATALKMHNKVRRHWTAERERVEREIAEMTRYPAAGDVRRLKSSAPEVSEPPHVGCYDAEKMQELQRRLLILQSTDMALMADLAHDVAASGLCEHERLATLPFTSGMRYFRSELDDHLLRSSCPAGVCHPIAVGAAATPGSH